MIKVIRAKLHGIRVTEADLNYHGSITIDQEICRLAGIYPLEFVYVWNKNSGRRISTYVIYGPPGSRCCILNGAAARTCQKGDEIIVCAVEYLDSPSQIGATSPQILTFTENNEIAEHLQYAVARDQNGQPEFSILKV